MEAFVRVDKNVLYILNVLKANGYEGYAVGGCVRDLVLGMEPNDWDIATDALPSGIKMLFERTVDTGLKHGTVTVLIKEAAYEITTFRIEGEYSDGRHPNRVEFTKSIEDDLRRRDFTMNAMAWNKERGIVDPFGGVDDIRKGLIRAVGLPEERFREDSLRMLRAVRFAARLGFEIHSEILKAIEDNRDLILNVSSERIREELNGILLSDNPGKLALLQCTGLLGLILPELEKCFATPQNNPHHAYNVGEHSLIATEAIEKDLCLRWTMLLHDVGKTVTRTTDTEGIDHYYGHVEKSVEISTDILKRLRFDNKSTEKILRLIKHHDREIISSQKAVAKAVNSVGDNIFTDLLKVKRADVSAQSPKNMKAKLDYVDLIERIYNQIKEKENCLSLKDLVVNGNDLIALGYKEGKDIGRVLSILLERVLEDPRLNEKEILLDLAAKEVST